MRIHNLYEDEDGQSHFRDIEVEWVEEPSYFFRLSDWEDRLPRPLREQPRVHRAQVAGATRSSASSRAA